MSQDVVLHWDVHVLLDSLFALFKEFPGPNWCWNERFLNRRVVLPIFILQVGPLGRTYILRVLSSNTLRVWRVVHFLELACVLKIDTVGLVSHSRLLNPLKSSRTNHIWIVHVIIPRLSGIPVLWMSPFNIFILLKHVIVDWPSHMPFTLCPRYVWDVHGISQEPGWRLWMRYCWYVLSLLDGRRSGKIVHVRKTLVMLLVLGLLGVHIRVLLQSGLHN